MRILLLFSFIFYILSYSQFTVAACQAVGGVRTINGNDLEIQHDIPIGTVLATFTIGPALTYKCDNNQNNYMTTGGKAYGEFAIKINDIRIFKTNIEGIGYSVGVRSMCGTTYYSGSGWKNNLNNISTCANSGTWNQITHNFEVRIYKIGPTGSGIVSKRQIGASILAYNNYNVWASENPVFLNAFKITTLGNNSGGWNNSGQGGSNSGGWNNSGQGGSNSGGWNNSGQGGSNSGGWNNSGQGGSNSGGLNNGGQGGSNNGGLNNGGQGGSNNGGSNSGGQGDNNNSANNNQIWPNNNNNNIWSNNNNNKIWPNNNR